MQDQNIQQDIEGVYLYEQNIITVSVQGDTVTARLQNGLPVPPMEVVLSGRKLSDEEARRMRQERNG